MTLQIIGWFGSALLVFSLLQKRMRLLRWFNLIASGILVIYNAAAHVWPMVGMNAAIVIIDICFLFAAARLRRSEDERYRTRSTRLR